MFNFFKKIYKSMPKGNSASTNIEPEGKVKLFASIDKNLKWFKENLYNTSDLVIREFSNPDFTELKGAILYLKGMADNHIINEVLLTTLLKDVNLFKSLSHGEFGQTKQQIDKYAIPIGETQELQYLDQALDSVISGDTLLLLSGKKIIFVFDTKGGKERAVGEPKTEQVIRGPQVSFVENLSVNISLIRRRSKDPRITFQKLTVGSDSKTEVVIAFHQDHVMKPVLEELLKRLKSVKVNRIEGAGILEQSIEDNTASLFPQFQYTERPDKVSAGLSEGRIGILVSGTPNVLMVPAPLASFFQSPEDYLEKWQIGTLLRWTRYASAFISSSLPALYIAIISYHPELLPTSLAFTIGVNRLAIPFPAFVEALMMEFVLEVLQEASIRLPKPIGQTVSIVGGLVIGQAAVQAGIISPIMVIIIAFTAISSFVIPSYNFNLTTRWLRLPYILATVFLGFYGLILAWLVTIIHLCGLETVGLNYMDGITPVNKKYFDTIFRMPLRFLVKNK